MFYYDYSLPPQYDCLSSAEFCISQARLVALQLAILQSGKVIINMEAKEVRKFMEEQPFSEVMSKYQLHWLHMHFV